MIKIVYITLVIVSNMVDQGRIILQNLSLCNLSIGYIDNQCYICYQICEKFYIHIEYLVKAGVEDIRQNYLSLNILNNHQGVNT